MTPESVKLCEPGLAAHLMDVIGHDFRCAPTMYLQSRPMPNWPARRPLVVGIPSAVFAVQWERDAQARALSDWGASFCGGLVLGDVMESDSWLK